MALKLKIIVGSTRPGRIGPQVAAWVDKLAREQNSFDVELVDLAEVGLPLLDEPNHPRAQDYQHEHTKKWAATIDEGDAYIFVTPEYDGFPPAALVNAIQALALEWNRKPAAVVSYGFATGGMRSMQELRGLLTNVNVMPLAASVGLPFVYDMLGEDGVLRAPEPVNEAAAAMFAEITAWGEALKPTRAAA